MALARRRAQIVWTGTTAQGKGRLTVDSGAFPEQTLTFAARVEEAGGKTSPEELIAAAQSACFAMALSLGLTQAGHPPEQLTVSAICSLDKVGGGYAITTMEIDVKGRVPGADAATFEQAVRAAETGCPVAKALHGNVEFRVTSRLES
ncbi:MAG: OsmC family peroxiredoxin [Chloroflexi bacterium]|nr:OsmC family peroxiredoxin [Chloroflexota bacterium]